MTLLQLELMIVFLIGMLVDCGQARREKISERMKILQDLVPGCNKVIFFSTCKLFLLLYTHK